jgi:hypothetical protein
MWDGTDSLVGLEQTGTLAITKVNLHTNPELGVLNEEMGWQADHALPAKQNHVTTVLHGNRNAGGRVLSVTPMNRAVLIPELETEIGRAGEIHPVNRDFPAVRHGSCRQTKGKQEERKDGKERFHNRFRGNYLSLSASLIMI